jgi:regulator of sigma E protease
MLEDLGRAIFTVGLFLVIINVLVVVHELGHFVTARLAGIRVHEFGLGFPPRAKVIGWRGETLYTLNWLPIGGFVRLEGEDGDDGDDPSSFARRSLPVRIVVLAAGAAMNVVLAFAIFLFIAGFASPVVGVTNFDVQPDSPAAAAGLVNGDAIIAVDGQRRDFFDPAGILGALRERVGETVDLEIEHADGTRETVTVTLRDQSAVDAGQGALGISSDPDDPWRGHFTGEYQGRDLPSAVGIAATEVGQALRLILGGLGSLAGSIAQDPTSPPEAAGPIGIAVELGNVFFVGGPILTLYLAALLSANLALVNILPFPPLDGGRIAVALLKSVGGRRISLRFERATYLVGFVFLFAFLIWITGFDIARLVGGDR